MTTTAPVKTVDFVSQGINTRLTIEDARKPQFDALGRVVVAASSGKAIQFEHNYARVAPAVFSETCPVCSGNGILVHDGEATDCSKCEGEGSVTRPASTVNGSLLDMPFDGLLAWMRRHESFNVFDKNCAFWEEGAAPDEPKPTLADQMKNLAEASAANDLGAVQEIRDLEEETHKRVAILQACESAENAIRLLAGINDTEPEAEAPGEGEPVEAGADLEGDE